MKETIRISSAAILIVDDEPINIDLLTEVLSINDYTRIFSTTDPREVEELCIKHEIDLIMLDINMPHLNGFEVMDRLKANEDTANTPVIVLTALADSDTCNKALRGGARDFLSKPFNLTEVLHRIRNALETHLLYKYVKNSNDKLEAQVKERTEEIQNNRIKVIRRLSRAAEFRDNETGLHILRMSHYSFLLAQAFGLSESDCEVILNASPLHDIGKIGIPDRILLKPGKLDSAEWEIMKTHSYIGEKILEGDNCELLSSARIIALTHHEKWDGNGYPNGLKGDDIPLMGRIVAIADVFDALTSTRPYKKAWTVDAALNYMLDQKAIHFDPELIDCFLALKAKLLKIQALYAEENEVEYLKHLDILSVS